MGRKLCDGGNQHRGLQSPIYVYGKKAQVSWESIMLGTHYKILHCWDLSCITNTFMVWVGALTYPLVTLLSHWDILYVHSTCKFWSFSQYDHLVSCNLRIRSLSNSCQVLVILSNVSTKYYLYLLILFTCFEWMLAALATMLITPLLHVWFHHLQYVLWQILETWSFMQTDSLAYTSPVCTSAKQCPNYSLPFGQINPCLPLTISKLNSNSQN